MSNQKKNIRRKSALGRLQARRNQLIGMCGSTAPSKVSITISRGRGRADWNTNVGKVLERIDHEIAVLEHRIV